jgi:hypothetical protein
MNALQFKETQAVAKALARKTLQRLTSDVGDSLGYVRKILGLIAARFRLGSHAAWQ